MLTVQNLPARVRQVISCLNFDKFELVYFFQVLLLLLCRQFGQLLAQLGGIYGSLALVLSASTGQDGSQQARTTFLVHEPVEALALAIAVLHRLALGTLLVRLLLTARATVAGLVLQKS